jgi:hypothetical protein
LPQNLKEEYSTPTDTLTHKNKQKTPKSNLSTPQKKKVSDEENVKKENEEVLFKMIFLI